MRIHCASFLKTNKYLDSISLKTSIFLILSLFMVIFGLETVSVYFKMWPPIDQHTMNKAPYTLFNDKSWVIKTGLLSQSYLSMKVVLIIQASCILIVCNHFSFSPKAVPPIIIIIIIKPIYHSKYRSTIPIIFSVELIVLCNGNSSL